LCSFWQTHDQSSSAFTIGVRNSGHLFRMHFSLLTWFTLLSRVLHLATKLFAPLFHIYFTFLAPLFHVLLEFCSPHFHFTFHFGAPFRSIFFEILRPGFHCSLEFRTKFGLHLFFPLFQILLSIFFISLMVKFK